MLVSNTGGGSSRKIKRTSPQKSLFRNSTMRSNGDLRESNPNQGPLEKLNTIQEQTPTVTGLRKVKTKCLNWDLNIDGRKGKRREKIDTQPSFPGEKFFSTTIERLRRVGYQKKLEKLAGPKLGRTFKECGDLGVEFPA
jgi:hypothetical protein